LQRVLNMLGLCARAGRIKTGLDGCEQAIKRQGATLCLVDGGISPASRKAMEDACRYAGAMLYELPPGTLGDAIGKPGRMAAAITDQGFAKRIQTLLNEADGKNAPA
jgi:ribosomal protein L7Ae-like RNA K-turn-binding protein